MIAFDAHKWFARGLSSLEICRERLARTRVTGRSSLLAAAHAGWAPVDAAHVNAGLIAAQIPAIYRRIIDHNLGIVTRMVFTNAAGLLISKYAAFPRTLDMSRGWCVKSATLDGVEDRNVGAFRLFSWVRAATCATSILRWEATTFVRKSGPSLSSGLSTPRASRLSGNQEVWAVGPPPLTGRGL